MQNDVDALYQGTAVCLIFDQTPFSFPKEMNLVGSKVNTVHVHVTLCIKHESTTNITTGYDTSDWLYSGSSSSYPHTKTSNNSFNYQSLHLECIQISNDFGITS